MYVVVFTFLCQVFVSEKGSKNHKDLRGLGRGLSFPRRDSHSTIICYLHSEDHGMGVNFENDGMCMPVDEVFTSK